MMIRSAVGVCGLALAVLVVVVVVVVNDDSTSSMTEQLRHRRLQASPVQSLWSMTPAQIATTPAVDMGSGRRMQQNHYGGSGGETFQQQASMQQMQPRPLESQSSSTAASSLSSMMETGSSSFSFGGSPGTSTSSTGTMMVTPASSTSSSSMSGGSESVWGAAVPQDQQQTPLQGQATPMGGESEIVKGVNADSGGYGYVPSTQQTQQGVAMMASSAQEQNQPVNTFSTNPSNTFATSTTSTTMGTTTSATSGGTVAPPKRNNARNQVDLSCDIRTPQALQVNPTWTSAFPGSGIKLLWKTIEALTGIVTSDDADSLGRLAAGTAVTVKTHFPSAHVSPKFFLMDTNKMKTAILLTRNPIDMFPSYYKFLYKYEFAGGEELPPIDKWVAWRNDQFSQQLDKWVEHTKWWVDNYGPSGRLMVLPFEHLVDPIDGPEKLKEIGMFLGMVDHEGVMTQNLTPESELPCLWEKMIGQTIPEQSILGQAMLENPGKPLNKNMRKKIMREASLPYPFTMDQLETMAKTLRDLKKEYKDNEAFGKVMAEYTRGVMAAKKKVEGMLNQDRR